MIILGWILFLAMLTPLFRNLLEQQNNPNQTPLTEENSETHTVTLQQNRFGHYVATGSINAQPVTLMLDTGATSVSIPEQLADQLQLRRGYASQVSTANGTITVYSTILEQVELGNIVLHKVRAHINPHMDGDEILLGMSFLKQLEFSQQGDKLTIIQRYFKNQ